MASNLSTHLPLVSTHRASIAFFLLIITIFAVPFFSLSTTSDLIPSANTLPTIAHTLWVSLVDILTSPPFFFLLLNFLIIALVFLSGVLDPSPAQICESDRLPDDDRDLHRMGLHNYPSAAQIFHERLAFDELYESQASCLPYLNIIESSLASVAGNGAVHDDFGVDDDPRIGKGKQIDLLSDGEPAFPNAGGITGAAEGVSGGGSRRAHATDQFSLASGMLREALHLEKISPAASLVLRSEIAPAHEVCQAIQAEENIQACESKILHPAERNASMEQTADVVKPGDGVIDDAGGGDVLHDEGGNDHIDDNKHGKIDQECNGIKAEETRKPPPQWKTPTPSEGPRKQRPRIARTPSEPIRQRHRIARTPSEPTIAGTPLNPQQRGSDMGRCMSLERVEWVGVEEQKQEEEEMMGLSREELNERASAFISAFRKKLAIDDASGQV